MAHSHIILKPTISFKKDYDMTEVMKQVEVPEESKVKAQKYLKSGDLSDDLGHDLLIEFEESIMFGFDFMHKGVKQIIPEINPTTIFFSNAMMFTRNLEQARQHLFENSPSIKNPQKNVDLKIFGVFFQYAVNCLINLQSTVECFANRRIPSDYECIDKDGNPFDPSIFHKLDKVLPDIYGKRFRSKFKRDNFKIRKIIELRNEIIHLTPSEDKTNTKYKALYRKIIKFDYGAGAAAVQNFVNFYEPGLLEECSCGQEHFYEIQIEINEKS